MRTATAATSPTPAGIVGWQQRLRLTCDHGDDLFALRLDQYDLAFHHRGFESLGLRHEIRNRCGHWRQLYGFGHGCADRGAETRLGVVLLGLADALIGKTNLYRLFLTVKKGSNRRPQRLLGVPIQPEEVGLLCVHFQPMNEHAMVHK